MVITPTEFLKLAKSIIQEFDGNAENLKSFLDSLNLVNSLKESHEALAVSLNKTKLRMFVPNRSRLLQDDRVEAMVTMVTAMPDQRR